MINHQSDCHILGDTPSDCQDERLCAARDAKVPCPVPVLYTGKTIFKGEHSGTSSGGMKDPQEMHLS